MNAVERFQLKQTMANALVKEAMRALPGPRVAGGAGAGAKAEVEAVGHRVREGAKDAVSGVRREAGIQAAIAQSYAGKGPAGGFGGVTRRAAGQGALAGAGLALGGRALLSRFGKKSVGQKLVGAMKAHKGKIMAGAGAAAGVGALAAYRKRNA